MLKTLSLMSSEEPSQCEERVDALTLALKAYYKQPGATQYNLNEALDALVTLTDRSQTLIHAEQQKKFLELKPCKLSLALHMDCPEHLVPYEIRNQRLQPFLPPPGKGVNPDRSKGGRNSILKTGNKRDPIRAQMGSLLKRQNHQAQKIKKILELLNL